MEVADIRNFGRTANTNIICISPLKLSHDIMNKKNLKILNSDKADRLINEMSILDEHAQLVYDITSLNCCFLKEKNSVDFNFGFGST